MQREGEMLTRLNGSLFCNNDDEFCLRFTSFFAVRPFKKYVALKVDM